VRAERENLKRPASGIKLYREKFIELEIVTTPEPSANSHPPDEQTRQDFLATGLARTGCSSGTGGLFVWTSVSGPLLVTARVTETTLRGELLRKILL
jgi:hypothetical protein